MAWRWAGLGCGRCGRRAGAGVQMQTRPGPSLPPSPLQRLHLLPPHPDQHTPWGAVSAGGHRLWRLTPGYWVRIPRVSGAQRQDGQAPVDGTAVCLSCVRRGKGYGEQSLDWGVGPSCLG